MDPPLDFGWGIYAMEHFGSGNWYFLKSYVYPTAGQWYHVCYVRSDKDNNNNSCAPNMCRYLYVNGTVAASDTGSLAYNISTTYPMIIGKRPDNVSYLNGYLDEVMVFNRALTQSEVRQLMMGFMPTEY